MKRRPSEPRGHALILALFSVALLGTCFTLSVQNLTAETREGALARDAIESFYAAEGGLAHARAVLATDPAHEGTTLRVGACAVTTAVRGAPASPQRTVTVRVDGRPWLEAELRLGAVGRLPEVLVWRECSPPRTASAAGGVGPAR